MHVILLVPVKRSMPKPRHAPTGYSLIGLLASIARLLSFLSISPVLSRAYDAMFHCGRGTLAIEDLATAVYQAFG
jgi:hypothetical protein